MSFCVLVLFCFSVVSYLEYFTTPYFVCLFETRLATWPCLACTLLFVLRHRPFRSVVWSGPFWSSSWAEFWWKVGSSWTLKYSERKGWELRALEDQSTRSAMEMETTKSKARRLQQFFCKSVISTWGSFLGLFVVYKYYFITTGYCAMIYDVHICSQWASAQ